MVPVHPPRGENSNIVRVYLSNLRGNANPISNYAATKRWSVSVHICSPEGTDPTPIFSGFPNDWGRRILLTRKNQKKTPKRLKMKLCSVHFVNAQKKSKIYKKSNSMFDHARSIMEHRYCTDTVSIVFLYNL